MTPWPLRIKAQTWRLRASTLALFLSLTLAIPCTHALFGVGDVVFDPTNLVQNAETAMQAAAMVAKAAEQIQNQIIMINHQVEQIQHQLTNLDHLDPSVLSNLNGQIHQFMGVLQHVNGLEYRVGVIAEQFNDLYPEFGLPPVDGHTYRDEQAKWNLQTRHALEDAMQAQSIVEQIGEDQANLNATVDWSQAAVGNLQVLQAGNQIQGLVATQLMRLQQIMAASGRAQAAEMARKAAENDAAIGNSKRMMECFDCMSPTKPMSAPPKLGF
jgi:P-type conjugative transfer protein TrbJ